MSRFRIYDLADALGIDLTLDHKKKSVRGETSRTIALGDLKVGIPLKVVSSVYGKDGVALIARSIGHLGVLAQCDGLGVAVYLLDLSKMEDPDGLCERKGWSDDTEVVAALRPAIARSYERIGKTGWRQEGA